MFKVQNNFTLQLVQMDQYNNLKENKVSDFQLEITKLEINGIETDNTVSTT